MLLNIAIYSYIQLDYIVTVAKYLMLEQLQCTIKMILRISYTRKQDMHNKICISNLMFLFINSLACPLDKVPDLKETNLTTSVILLAGKLAIGQYWIKTNEGSYKVT